MMWYGVLGTKELLHRTYRNLEQKVLLEVSKRVSCRQARACLVSCEPFSSLGVGSRCPEVPQ